MEHMNYDQALEKIHEFNVFGSKLGLERMKKLLSLLGDPHKDMKIIHVAGTNGKGSVCRYIYTVLNECGYKAGAYFSPYLEEFTERIECGGRQIGKDELPIYTEQALAAVEQMMSEGYESPTEFELVTAIGLLYFKAVNADFVVLEVGLGGRGDSTNICDRPVATVIASISYDHMNVLGSTLEEIAYDKAGIIKRGVPVCVNVKDQGAFDVIQKQADELAAPVVDLRQASVKVKSCDINGSTFTVGLDGLALFKDISIKMCGRHQIENAVCALAAIAIMRIQGFRVPDDCVRAGMKKAFQPGRFELISKEPYMIIDGAHNRAGVTALVDTLTEEFSIGAEASEEADSKNSGARILLCTGILADKETEIMASQFARLRADVITTTVPNPRTMSAQELAGVFGALEPYSSGECSVTAIDDWHRALDEAEKRRGDYDVIVWAGSLYLIGPVRGVLTNEKK